MIEGPRRVTIATGQPQKREEQRQALIVSNVPVERQEGSDLRRYALGRELVRVTFDGDYVAGTAKTVSVKLGRTPSGFNWHVYDAGTLDLSGGASILVVPVNRTEWTESSLQVACNRSGSDGVTITIEAY